MQSSVLTFGKTASGETVHQYTLTNDLNAELKVITYGGIITHLTVPDQNGHLQNVVLGLNTLDDYENRSPYYGTITGRFAGRIGNGSFTLDATTYTLPQNDSTNCLHGGIKSLSHVVYDATVIEKEDALALVLSTTSPHLSEGFPGTIELSVTYTWDNHNTLTMDYHATTSHKTYLNLTNHTYFNLSGNPSQPIIDHDLTLHADQFVGIDAKLLPLAIYEVKNTPFDFTKPTHIGHQLAKQHPQLEVAGGIDHPFLLNHNQDVVATLSSPTSGIHMDVYTHEKFAVIYCGNQIQPGQTVYNQIPIQKHAAICIETQDCPNHMHFDSVDSTVLTPDDPYQTQTVYRFYL